MQKYKVHNVNDAFVYILDCQLATIDSMAMRKSRSKSEYSRQVSIAQTMFDWCMLFDLDVSSTRGEDVKKNFKNSVQFYADYYDILK